MMETDILYWHWLVFGMLLVMLEIFLPSFTALWFGLGAVLVGLVMLVWPEVAVGWQIFIWAVASAIFTASWFKYFKPLSVDRTKAGLSREAILGETAQVIKTAQGEERGHLRFTTPILGSEEWPFISTDSLNVGDRVVVRDVSGNTLVVEKC